MAVQGDQIGDLAEATSAAGEDWIELEIKASGLSRKINKDNYIGASLVGGGVIDTGGFTLTVPATGTAALLAAMNVFTANQTINGALDAELQGVNDSHVFRGAAGQVAPVVNIPVTGGAPQIAAGDLRTFSLVPASNFSSTWRINIEGTASFGTMGVVRVTIILSQNAGNAPRLRRVDLTSWIRGSSSVEGLETNTLHNHVDSVTVSVTALTDGIRYDISPTSGTAASNRTAVVIESVARQALTVTHSIL